MMPQMHELNSAAALLPARLGLALAIAAGSMFFGVGPTHALSEIKREELPAPITTPQTQVPAPSQTTPQPDATAPTTPAPGDTEEPAPDGEEGQVPDETDSASPEADAPLPEIQYDLSKLPEAVQHTRNMIVEAAKTGDIEKLRPLIGMGDEQTQLSLGGIDGDPIKFLRELSGDSEGQEILAIVEEVLSAGYVHMEPGTESDFYVWPYFFAIPLDKLTAAQRVELFKIVTAGDYEDMKTYGAYIFYRIGITPQGKWSFFIAGD